MTVERLARDTCLAIFGISGLLEEAFGVVQFVQFV